MKTSLNNFRQDLLESTLALLWRQWTLLGVPGHAGDGEESRIIDPEALLLITTEVGRFDARLMDEATNWLLQYGKLINIQRLRSLHQQHHFGNGRVLAAMAATVLQNSRLAKWKAVELMAEPQTGEEPLFRNPDGTPVPVFGKADAFFERFGFFRGTRQTRADASAPGINKPDLLLMKLRALLGVNARAEIIAALLTTKSTHPSGLARRTGYLPRSVQDILNEMVLSGHVMSDRSGGTRERHFSLRPDDWDFLITWPDQKLPEWVDWTILFALIQDVLKVLFDEQGMSPLMTALRLREILDRYSPALSEAGLLGSFSRSAHETGTGFLEVFLAELTDF